MSDPTPEPIPDPNIGPDPVTDPAPGAAPAANPGPAMAGTSPWWRRAGVVGGVGAVVGFAAGLGGAVALHELTEGDRGDGPAAIRGWVTDDDRTVDDADGGTVDDDGWSAARAERRGPRRGDEMFEDQGQTFLGQAGMDQGRGQGQAGMDEGRMGQLGPAGESTTGAS